MGVAAPADGYKRFVHYAAHKTTTSLPRLIVESLMAGVWVAVYGHCCMSVAAFFYNPAKPSSAAIQRLAYGILFPGAFVAIAFTGTELFTGNTAAMTMWVLNKFSDNVKHQKHHKMFADFTSTIRPALRVCGVSFLGNFFGAVLGAWLLSYQSNVFSLSNSIEATPQHAYLMFLGHHKTSYRWFGVFSLAIGCNMLVCLASWCTVIIGDGAGKIMAMWFTVGVFAMGGFEHIIANFYTLSLFFMVAPVCVGDGATRLLARIIFRNWVPVCLGNIVGGCFFTGTTWWFTLAPTTNNYIRASAKETSLLLDKSARYAY